MDKIVFNYFESEDSVNEIIIECPFNVPSVRVKDKILEIEERFVENINKLTDKYKLNDRMKSGLTDGEIAEINELYKDNPDLAEITKANKILAMAEGIKNDKDLKLDYTKYGIEVQKLMDNAFIEKIKVIVNTRQLTTDKKEWINKPYNHDFWRSQDLENIRMAVDFFCKKLNPTTKESEK